MEKQETVLFLSELAHVSRAEKFIAEHSDLTTAGYILVALDSTIEWELARKRIPFLSGRDFRTRDTKPMILAEEWATRLLTHPEWSFFVYRNVSFARVYFFPLQICLARILYYADIITGVFTTYPSLARCVLFTPKNAVLGLLGQDHSVFAEAAMSTARGLGKEVVIAGDIQSVSPSSVVHSASFKIRRGFFSVVLGLLNVLVTLVRRPKKVRILAYDSWRNIAPVVRQVHSGEVVMIERLEAFVAGLKNIFGYRMRFVGFGSFISTSVECTEAQALFKREQERLNREFDYSFATFRGVSHAELLRDVLGICVQDAIQRSLSKVDAAYALLEHLKPSVVLMRITASTLQSQFPILAQVARVMGIPALEIQHGLNYNGPGTPSKFYNAEYLGVYGQLSIDELVASGRSVGTTPIAIGSPRFDTYTLVKQKIKENTPGKPLSVTVIAASPLLAVQLDTYDVEEYFKAIATAVKNIGGIAVTIKLRASTDRPELFRPLIAKAFEGVPHTVVDTGSLIDLLSQSDIAVSCFSTAAIEVLLCGVPLTYLGLSPAEKMMGTYHFAPYATAGAMEMAHTQGQFEE
ncbi:hypothetical protein EXS57_01300, partial [Candidatus Kaiserbacteria bacterium]|nr:hypothetical protein [Candidatus Kaiserbacteria bacterium]